MIKVVSTAKIKSDLKKRLVSTFPNVDFYFFSNIKEAENDLIDAEIMITYGEDLSDTIIKNSKMLKWIMVISAGIDQIPFAAIKEKRIAITNVRGIHKIPMAEYTMAMILQIAKKSKQLIENERNHIWDRRVSLTEIYGKTIGILGTGAIGSYIAQYAKAFSLNVLGYNRSGKFVEYFDEITTIDTLLRNSDFVVNVLPSTSETKHLLKRDHFKMMKSDGIFINIGRGSTVVESDLIAALNENEIAHAVLDVFAEEPLRKDHPFWDMENVTITPHLSGVSSQYQRRALKIFEDNLSHFIKTGKFIENVIDIDRGY